MACIEKQLLYQISLGFACCALLFIITALNKVMFAVFKFPSFQTIAIAVMLASLVILFAAKLLGLIAFQDVNLRTLKKVYPLSITFGCNFICSVGALQELTLTTFIVLRRLVIVETMIAEYFVMKIRPSVYTQLSVGIIVAGTFLFAGDGLSFNAKGYIYAFINDLSVTLNGVYNVKKLTANEIETYGLLYYNSMLVIIPACVVAFFTGDLSKALDFNGWANGWFLASFCGLCVLSVVLCLTSYTCALYNSALTISVIICLENVVVSYVGLCLHEYKFTWTSFMGLNVSVLGILLYCYSRYRSERNKSVVVKDAVVDEGETISLKNVE